MANDIDHALKGFARMVLAEERQIGVLSTGERIAVALILDRPNLFPNGGYTVLEAVDRLGREWTEAAFRVQRAGLQCEETAHG
jgi:hypothetical protein